MNYDLLQTITGIVGSITGITGIITIFLFLKQIKNESRWNKIKFSIDKFDTSLLSTNVKAIKDFGINMKEEKMSDEEYEKFIDLQNPELFYKACDILDMLEKFAILYNMNALNKSFSYESYSENVIFFYLKFKRIIDFYRNNYDPFYYNNFEICAKEFIKKRNDEQRVYKRDNKKLEKLQAKIRRRPRIFKEKF